MTVALNKNIKLFLRFYGPFEVLKSMGSVAYRLDLPDVAQIYLIFYVSLLKKKLDRTNQRASQLPPVDSKGLLKLEPEVVLGRKVRKKRELNQ